MFPAGASDRGKTGWILFVVSALATSAPQASKASFRRSRGTLTPFQCHLDVQRCPKPPVQGQLNVQRRPKLQFQCQLDVQRCPKRRSKANLTFKGAQNRRSRANSTFKSCPKPPVQSQIERQCNKKIKVARQYKTSANAIERQCNKTIKVTRQDTTSANATERPRS